MAEKEKGKKSRKAAETVEETTPETAAEEQALETVLKTDFDALKDQSLRLAAEYDNYKKRTVKEKEHIYEDAIADTVVALLPAMDAIDSATALLTPEQVEEGKGFLAVFQLMKEVLIKLGVETVGDPGDPFDPNYHNAVMMEDGDGEHKIAQVFQRGYRYKEKVIRAAMVKVTAN